VEHVIARVKAGMGINLNKAVLPSRFTIFYLGDLRFGADQQNI
jgi:hypothetical protein